MALKRDEILGALDLHTEEVPVPRWGGTVLVKALPMASRRYTNYVTGGSRPPKGGIPQREEFIRRMIGAVVLSALDPETEEPMFTFNDADELREKHWNSVLIVANKAFELAGDPEDDTDDVEEDPDSAAAIEAALEDIDEDDADLPLGA